ncbi:MAG: hypothetical protein U0234_25240 [Sandaracinus sp.]
MKPRLTVGSLRGVAQGAHPAPRPLAPPPPGLVARPRKCCGTGCADCPIGRRIRAARAGLPVAE